MNTQAKDAIELLTSDHERVKKQFKDFQALGDKAFKQKKQLADKICNELLVHTQIEEEILYPVFLEHASDEKPLVDEATVEHGTAKQLISQIQKMDSDQELFDARVKVLSEYINHHVKEEEEEMFPKLRATKVDLNELGERLHARKQELM